MQLDFFTILLEILVREQLSRRKLSFREVVYMLAPRHYPLGDYYVCECIVCWVGVESVYFRRDMHVKGAL